MVELAWRRALALLATLCTSVAASTSFAGPPYTTDDPEPVEHRHWELYLASQQFHDAEGWAGTAPHFEVNYGVVPGVQLHLLMPLAYSAPHDGAAHYGYGDTEVGAKFRFAEETKWAPMIGSFPLLELPTGNPGSALGNGNAQLFVPVWLQKGFGRVHTYGGGGVWFDFASLRRTSVFLGWQAEWHAFDFLSLGGEIFYQTAKDPDEDSDARFNLGAVIDLGDTHHLLLSGGRSFAAANLFQAYAAWLVTFGPEGR